MLIRSWLIWFLEGGEWSTYSFDPEANNSHNCVTWACSYVNLVLGMVLSVSA